MAREAQLFLYVIVLCLPGACSSPEIERQAALWVQSGWATSLQEGRAYARGKAFCRAPHDCWYPPDGVDPEAYVTGETATDRWVFEARPPVRGFEASQSRPTPSRQACEKRAALNESVAGYIITKPCWNTAAGMEEK